MLEIENAETLDSNELKKIDGGFLVELAAAATIYGCALASAYYLGYACGKYFK